MVDVSATGLALSAVPDEQLTSLRLAVLCDLPPADMVSVCVCVRVLVRVATGSAAE